MNAEISWSARFREDVRCFLFHHGHALARWVRGLPREIRIAMALKSIAARERRQLWQARELSQRSDEAQDLPLVSVAISTYNRGRLLVERTLPSVFRQTYQNLEIVIVGDCCTDDTAARIAALGDLRIRFSNLPEQPRYPETPLHRWMVNGSTAMNLALQQARGIWIAHLDDDDLYDADHIRRVLEFARARGYELAYSRMKKQTGPDFWKVMGSAGFSKGSVPHSSVIFRSYLKVFAFDPNCWRLGIAGDKHMWLRMDQAGVHAGFLDEVTTSSPLRPGTTDCSYRAEDRELAVRQA